MRIISLVPSITELLVDLGAEDELVGITKFCAHPNHLRRTKQVVGGTKNVNLERVRALQPDLVIANKEENRKEDVEAIAMEFPVYVNDVNDLASALEMIRETGRLIQRFDSADQLAEQISKKFIELGQRTKNVKPKKVAYLIWNEPLMVAGGGTYINDMLEPAGFVNVFSGLPRYPEVTTKMLQAAQPELLLLSTEPYPFKQKHVTQFRELFGIPGVQLVDGEMFSWYGSRMLLAARYFRQLQTVDF